MCEAALAVYLPIRAAPPSALSVAAMVIVVPSTLDSAAAGATGAICARRICIRTMCARHTLPHAVGHEAGEAGQDVGRAARHGGVALPVETVRFADRAEGGVPGVAGDVEEALFAAQLVGVEQPV